MRLQLTNIADDCICLAMWCMCWWQIHPAISLHSFVFKADHCQWYNWKIWSRIYCDPYIQPETNHLYQSSLSISIYGHLYITFIYQYQHWKLAQIEWQWYKISKRSGNWNLYHGKRYFVRFEFRMCFRDSIYCKSPDTWWKHKTNISCHCLCRFRGNILT